MISQEEQNHDEIVDLSSALMSALGMQSEEGERIQTTNIFLCKLFQKHCQQTKKINEVKISRLNAFLCKVCKQPPSQTENIELISQIIMLFLNSQGASPITDRSFALNTCIWVAKCIEEMLAVHLPEQCLQIVKAIIKQKKLPLISPEDYSRAINNSHYLKDNEITKMDEVMAHKKTIFKGFMSQFSIYEEIEANFRTELLFSNLYLSHPSKPEVLKVFVDYCREVAVGDLKGTFVRVFVANRVHDKSTLNSVLDCLDSELFTADDFTEIVRLLLANNDRRLFYSLNIKGFKMQTRYLEILSEEMKPNLVDELANIFISEKGVNNYYIIYLIHKCGQKLPDSYLVLPLNRVLTNREAIVCALCINQNIENAHSKIIESFFESESKLSTKQKLDYLKIAHFSYINVPKSHLFTAIIKSLPYTALDAEADFQFLPKEGYDKIHLGKAEKQKLSDFSNRYFGNSDEVYWLKLDLYAICGKQLPCMQDFKKVQKIFEAPIDQVLQDLPNTAENLIEVVLMGVNNKLADQFVVTQATSGTILQWAVEQYKKQYKKFRSNVEAALKKTNNLAVMELCLDIFEFNMDQKTEMELSEELRPITSPESRHKLNGLHFSQYFMGCDPDRKDLDELEIRNKVVVVQLQKLIKNLSNDSKTLNRKQIKTLVSEESTPLRALKIIKSFSLIPFEKLKNPEKLQGLSETLLSYIKPDHENLKQLSQRANNVNIPYSSIFESLQFLLTVNYEKSINFLAQLLSSKQEKGEQKHEKAKKTGKRKADQQAEKKAEESSLIDNLQYCFKGDPNSLTSYDSIISIVEYIEKSLHHEHLSEEVTRWVSRIKIFYHEDYKEWMQKVYNYVRLWQSISGIVSHSISLEQIERHFLILINLLNTLYEKHKQQKDYLMVEKKLLNGLHVLYVLAENTQAGDMEEESNSAIPREKLNEVILNQEVADLGIPHIYYCYDCSKKVCHECATIIHRNHDKNYVGNGNQNECHRFGTKSKDIEKARATKEKYIQKLIREGGDSIERQRQKILIISQAAERLPPEQFARFKQEKLTMLRRNQRLSTLLAHTESQEGEDEDRKKEDPDEPQKFQIKSCSEKEFGIKNPTLLSMSRKPKPIFESSQGPCKSRKSRLNLSPLFNLLVREIQSSSLFTSTEFESEQRSSASLFEAQISNEKYTILKVDHFKNGIPRMSGNLLANQEQHPNALLALVKRNTVTINEKLLMVLSGGYCNQLHYLDTNTIRSRFIKKETEKRYKENDALETYQINQTKLSETSILEITTSPYVHNLIAEVSGNKILFQQISKDARNKLICLEQAKNQIVKFQWLKSHGLKSFHAYLAGDVVIGKIGKRDLELKHRITLGEKKIKDFSNCMLSSKTITLTLLDTEGKLYRSKCDPYNNKKPVNFTDFKVNFSSPELITSICSHGNLVVCTTASGKITVLTFNEENSIANLPSVYPIIEQLKSHKISEINMNFKELSKISKLRYITKHQNQIFVSCLLVKQNTAESRKGGYFAILCLNLQTKKCKLMLYNDQGITDSYDFIVISDKEFLFVCLQDDGQMWACKLTAHPKSASKLNQTSLCLPLQPADISLYAQQISRLKLLDEIEFYSQQRKKPAFKQNLKISDHYKHNITTNSISFEVSQKFSRSQFVTGIEFGYNHNGDTDEPVSHVCFSFLGNMYRFDLTRTREIQIPLTIKESIAIFFGLQQFKIKFIEGNPLTNLRDLTMFGVKLTEKSIYSEALNNICEMLCIYNCPKQLSNDKKLERYFYNENRTDLKSVEPKALEQYLTKIKLSLEQQNLLLKLELLRQSVQKYKSDTALIAECFECIRNHILPNCNERKELVVSVYKLCQALTESSQDLSALKLGHPLNFQTQLDIYSIFKVYKNFKAEATVDTYQDLLSTICKIFNSRTVNGIIVLKVYPNIFEQICKFFRHLLLDYKIYFKTNDHGLEKDERQKLNKMCSNLMRLLIENYQIDKNNQKIAKLSYCENYLIMTLQAIFCLHKKQVHKEIKLNPFQYFESTFQEGQYLVRNPPLNYLELQKIDLEGPKKQVKAPQVPEAPEQSMEPQINMSEPNHIEGPNIQGGGPGLNEVGDSQSFEEHKQQEEENRQMEEYAYDLQEGGLNVIERQILEEEEDSEIDIQIDQSIIIQQIDTKKIFDCLSTECLRMTPEEIEFSYYGVCENILLEFFSSKSGNGLGQYKNLDNVNLVFYVGFVYNLIQIIDKKISTIFGNTNSIDFSHPYIQDSIVPIIKSIDQKIDSPAHSVFYLSLNSLIATNPKLQSPNSAFLICLLSYYKANLKGSKLLACLASSRWYPDEYKKPASISSVLRFQYFDTINPIYQMKYVGNLYLSMIKTSPNDELLERETEIKENILKAIVRFNLRVYQNIMVIQGWAGDLENTKVKVAFQKLQSNPEQSLKTIIKSIGKDIKPFIEDVSKNGQRISSLECLLGTNSTLDELILQILNSFYSYEFPSST